MSHFLAGQVGKFLDRGCGDRQKLFEERMRLREKGGEVNSKELYVDNEGILVEDTVFEELLHLRNATPKMFPGYTVHDVLDGLVEMYIKRVSRTDWDGMLFLHFPKSNFRRLIDLCFDMDFRILWDPFCACHRVLKLGEDGTELLYITTKMPRVLSDRDVLQLRRRKDAEDFSCGVLKSVEHPLMPAQKEFVRANLGFVGFLAEPDPAKGNGWTRMIIRSRVDGGSYVPEWVANLIIPIVLDTTYTRMMNAVDDLEKYLDTKASTI